MKNDDIYFYGKDKVVSHETAVMARLKNFDFPTLHVYNEKGELAEDEDIWFYGCEGGMRLDEWFHKFNQNPKENTKWNETIKWFVSAPTQNQIKTWLREKHNIIVEIHVANTNDPMDWICTVKKINKSGNWYTKYRTIEILSYEDTLEEGLFKALGLIK